jgi:CcmD family protein
VSDPSVAYLGAAFAIVWVVMGAYLIRLWRMQKDITRRLDALAARTRPPGTEGTG